VFVVTGGTSGIGRAVAERLAADGAAVVLGARRDDLGEQVAASIRASGGEALFVSTDATVEADVAALVDSAVARFGRLDGAFNNAGGVNASGEVHALESAAWHADLDQNLSSVFYSLKYEIPAIVGTAGRGSIVNNASLAGTIGVPGLAAYGAAKHGVVGLTRAAALENASRGLRINALITGNVDTPLFRRLLGAAPEDRLDADSMNPTGRVAQPSEIAAFVAFLLDDQAAFITGAALAIDGGFTAQ
jgi:NAD(P)-dependent dehydrogenase (short-subunit alcohol dehydrogenase family)